jgi:putative two-component system response regulator
VGIADVFDALSSRRAYKDAWTEEKVLEFIRAESGRHFDPELVEILFARLDEIRTVRSAHLGD